MALDQDTINGFNELFESMAESETDEDNKDDLDGSTSEDEGNTDDEGDGDDSDDDDSDSDDNTSDDDSDDDSDDGDDDSDGEATDKKKSGTKDDKQRAKQNFAFAQQRQKLKAQDTLIRNLGKAIGLADGLSVEEIAGKVNEVLLTKESQKTGIPVETLQEINQLRSLVEENKTLKRQDEVKGEFSKLIERYELSSEQVDEFTAYLIENGKNPLEIDGINIQFEYYQLHEQDILNQAIEEALNKESKRKSKVKDKAGTKTPGSSKNEDEGQKKIESVADLDKYFDSLDI